MLVSLLRAGRAPAASSVRKARGVAPLRQAKECATVSGHPPRALPLSPVLHGELAALQVTQTHHSGAVCHSDFSPVPPVEAVSHLQEDLCPRDRVSLLMCAARAPPACSPALPACLPAADARL